METLPAEPRSERSSTLAYSWTEVGSRNALFDRRFAAVAFLGDGRWVSEMSRLAMVIVVAVLNLGLGFLAGHLLGRRRPVPLPHEPPPAEPAPVDPVNLSFATDPQLLAFLENAEKSYEELLKRFLSNSPGSDPSQELVTALDRSLKELAESVPAEAEKLEAMVELRRTLELARTGIAEHQPLPDGGEADPVDWAELVMTRCRESRGALTALQFVGM